MKRYITLIVLSVLIIIVASLGLTYAFMKNNEEGKEQTNIAIKTCAKITFIDNNETIINLENTYPMDDEMGLETKPYEFTISSTCEEYVGFNLYLTSLTDNEIEDKNIKYAVTNVNGDVLISDNLTETQDGIRDFNEEELNQLEKGIKGTRKKIYKVYNNNISNQNESKYKLYLWVDSKTTNETMDKSFKLGVSVKSYKREETFAEYLIKNKDNTLIYHDGKPDYETEENANLEANDLSYRYSGASEDVNNYICFKSNDKECTMDDLYRIIGLFKNKENNYEVKVMKADYTIKEQTGGVGIGSCFGLDSWGTDSYKGLPKNLESIMVYFWSKIQNGWGDLNNNWYESDLNKINLNDVFYKYIITTYPKISNYIVKNIWYIGGNTPENILDTNVKSVFESELGKNKFQVGHEGCLMAQNESKKCEINDLIYQNYIGLIYISDYGYASKPSSWTNSLTNYKNDTSNNWMYMGLYEYTITRDPSSINYIYRIEHDGNLARYTLYNARDTVRPTFYLSSDVKIKSGEGTYEKPYRINYEN